MRNATSHTPVIRRTDNDNGGAPVAAPMAIPVGDFVTNPEAVRALVANGGGAMTALCDLLCEAYFATSHDNDNRN